jgi:hypothetical protein
MNFPLLVASTIGTVHELINPFENSFCVLKFWLLLETFASLVQHMAWLLGIVLNLVLNLVG